MPRFAIAIVKAATGNFIVLAALLSNATVLGALVVIVTFRRTGAASWRAV